MSTECKELVNLAESYFVFFYVGGIFCGLLGGLVMCALWSKRIAKKRGK